MRDEKILVVSRRETFVDLIRKEAKEYGLSFVTVIDSAPRAMTALWSSPPDLVFFDLVDDKPGVMEILPVLMGAGKPLARLAAIAISSYGAEEDGLKEEQALLEGLGVHESLPKDHDRQDLSRLIRRALFVQSREEKPAAKEQSILLFLNDRNRNYTFRKRLTRPGRTLNEIPDMESLCRAFLDDAPDVVLLDPRGLGDGLVTLEKTARHFPSVSILMLVPQEQLQRWTARQPKYVSHLLALPESEEDFAGLSGLIDRGEEEKEDADTGETAAPEAPAGGMSEPLPPPTILVVDDDLAVRHMLVQFLEFSGYVCLEAGDGREALKVLRATKVNLLISDIYMPRMNGFQLFMEVHNNWPEIPVVLITGYNSAAKDMASYKINDAEFLEKPFELATVDSLIKAKLAG